MKKKFLFVVNDPTFFLSHRLPLAIAVSNEGFNVHVATSSGIDIKKIIALGFTHHILPLSRSGRNPLKELVSLFLMWRLFIKLKPILVHLVTIKPVIYGGIAARMANVPSVVSAISGLGFLFVTRANVRLNLMKHLVLILYRIALRHSNQRVIFQNSSDMNTLILAKCVHKNRAVLIRGSGVDLSKFCVRPEPKGNPVIVMASRLLKDKGVHEFINAARLIRSQNIKVRFLLIGAPDQGNPENIPIEIIRSWQAEGIVEYLGFCSDIAEIFSKSNIIILPSYREGLPKVLIEAAACGRAVITTDAPGCCDAIEPNKSGLLVPARNVKALACAISILITDTTLRKEMGKAGRILAEREFGIDKIVSAHLKIYFELI